MAQAVIIGAGISGLSCAWRLKELGMDAVVLEAGSQLSLDSPSARFGHMIRAFYQLR